MDGGTRDAAQGKITAKPYAVGQLFCADRYVRIHKRSDPARGTSGTEVRAAPAA